MQEKGLLIDSSPILLISMEKTELITLLCGCDLVILRDERREWLILVEIEIFCLELLGLA